jgi:3-oxoacyl-[acyl-carrier-protein] synthase-3
MALFKVEDISIKGITCCVPKTIERNIDLEIFSKDDIEKFIKNTGIEERRIASEETCASDLCYAAAEDLIEKLNWKKSEIELVVFVSQTADYILPVTSTILQDRLGLATSCVCFDVPLGCSGYVYGMSIVASMMQAMGIKKGLLLAGDTSSKYISKTDKSSLPLFGDAGSATAFEKEANSEGIAFDLGSDGAGAKAIIIEDGGTRNMFNTSSLENKIIAEGIERNACNLVLEGMDVFSFGITQAPKTVNNLIDTFKLNKDNIDYFVFHQANKMMNKLISKKLKLPTNKVPYSLKEFGNTSSASIPLTIVSQLKNELQAKKETKFILCGFGVGLSWGTAAMVVKNSAHFNLIEL